MGNPKPQVTRIAAYGLLQDKGKLLLCRISAGLPQTGWWTLPGGGLEFGEHPESGMVREVFEETGLHVEPCLLAGIDSFHGEEPDRALHSIRIIYHASILGGTLRFEKEGTTDMCQWYPLEKVAGLKIVDLVEAALPMVHIEGA